MLEAYPHEEFIEELKVLRRYAEETLENLFPHIQQIIKRRKKYNPNPSSDFDWEDFDKCDKKIQIILRTYPRLRDKYGKRFKGLNDKIRGNLGHRLSSDPMI